LVIWQSEYFAGSAMAVPISVPCSDELRLRRLGAGRWRLRQRDVEQLRHLVGVELHTLRLGGGLRRGSSLLHQGGLRRDGGGGDGVHGARGEIRAEQHCDGVERPRVSLEDELHTERSSKRHASGAAQESVARNGWKAAGRQGDNGEHCRRDNLSPAANAA